MKNLFLALFSLTGALAVSLALSAQGRGGRGGPPVTLPDGAAKETVQALCANCHGLNMLVNSGGYTKDGWKTLISTMVALPTDQVDAVTGYLATNFPEKPRPAAVVIPGTAKVTFKEWALPTLGSRPHDPLATPDGMLWYTGQFSNRMGRVDMKTGAFKEFALLTPE